MWPSVNLRPDSMLRVRRETSRMAPTKIRKSNGGPKAQTLAGGWRTRELLALIQEENRPPSQKGADGEANSQEGPQRSVRAEAETASNTSAHGAQITWPLRPMRQAQSGRTDPMCRLRAQASSRRAAQQSESQTPLLSSQPVRHLGVSLAGLRHGGL